MAAETVTIEGRHAVLEALRAGHPISEVYLLKGMEKQPAAEMERLCEERGVPYFYTDRTALDRRTSSSRHQGVIAVAAPWEFTELDDILAAAQASGEPPFLVLLDGIMDPQNLGAIIRTANMAGAHGVVIMKDRASGLTPAVAKASAGAIYYTPIARVTNMTRTIEKLKKSGLWIACADMDGDPLYDADLSGPIALVIGSEGKGVPRLVKKSCDMTLAVPTFGKIDSLNASVACGLFCFEVVRARLKKR